MRDIKYVAFDVHKSTIFIVVLSLKGEVVTQAVIKTDASAIRDFLRGLSGHIHLTFEEGCNAQWLYDLTRSLVAELIVCNPRHSSPAKGRNKSDKIDALGLARDLRAGLLKGVYHGSASTQTLKQLVHNYDSITSDTTRVMNRLKSLFRSQAINCSGRAVYYSRNRDEWLAKLAEEGLRMRAEFLYKQLDHLRPLRRDAKREMLREAGRHAAFKRLAKVAGLGPVRVSQIIAGVGSPHRFRTKREFWSYCGLAVVTRSSADYEIEEGGLRRRPASTQTRGLVRDYNRGLKRVFKSAALEAMKSDKIKAIYSRLVGQKIRPEMARLTIARKLAAVSLAIWKSGEEYDESKLTKLVA